MNTIAELPRASPLWEDSLCLALKFFGHRLWDLKKYQDVAQAIQQQIFKFMLTPPIYRLGDFSLAPPYNVYTYGGQHRASTLKPPRIPRLQLSASSALYANRWVQVVPPSPAAVATNLQTKATVTEFAGPFWSINNGIDYHRRKLRTELDTAHGIRFVAVRSSLTWFPFSRRIRDDVLMPCAAIMNKILRKADSAFVVTVQAQYLEATASGIRSSASRLDHAFFLALKSEDSPGNEAQMFEDKDMLVFVEEKLYDLLNGCDWKEIEDLTAQAPQKIPTTTMVGKITPQIIKYVLKRKCTRCMVSASNVSVIMRWSKGREGSDADDALICTYQEVKGRSPQLELALLLVDALRERVANLFDQHKSFLP